MPSNKKTKEDLLKEYLSLQLLYVDFTNYVENKIKNLLIEHNVRYQAVSSRVKSYDSLDKKLDVNIINAIHKNIKNLNDLSGVRIIFYDEVELKRFKTLVSDCFKIEYYKPSDDITKYDGTNITVSLKEKVSKFSGLKCEVQLTTLLAHAINEFGHDIIYKGADELKSKDKEEYEKIEEIFKDARNNVLKIYASLEVINRRVQSIRNGSKDVELIISDDIIREIESIQQFNDLEVIIEKMTEIIPLVNKDQDKYEKIKETKTVLQIVNKFGSIPHEDAVILNYDNYEYKYTKLLEFLQSYRYLWLEDFKPIMEILYVIAKDNDIVKRFDDFVENLLNSDNASSIRGYANYNIHERAFLLILDDSVCDHVRLRLAESYCDLEFHYCKNSSIDKLSLVRGKVPLSEEYKQHICQVITAILNMFFRNNSEEKIRTIININYGLERDSETFAENPIYDFFYKHYDEISIYYKNKLYESISQMAKSKFKTSKFYKKIKQDHIQVLFAMLFNYHIEEPIGATYAEKEEYRKKYLSEFIENFEAKNIEDICLILNELDIAETNTINMYRAGNYFFEIAHSTKYGKTILKKKWNEYILLGVMKRDIKYIPDTTDITAAVKIIKAMKVTQEVNKLLLNNLIKFVDKSQDCSAELELLKLIANNSKLNIEDDYKNYFLDKIENYNKKSVGIIGEVLVDFEAGKVIIDKYKKREINKLLKNYRYCEFGQLDEFFLNDLFEKYPDSLRKLFEWKAINYPKKDLFNSYNFIDLSGCANFQKELAKNLSLCVKILKSEKYFKSNYIHYLLGKYNEGLESTILDYLEKNTDYEDYCAIVRMCDIYELSLKCWKVYEKIITNIDEGDKLLDEIDCNLFNGVYTGRYGLANSFNEKYEFFAKLKSKNNKIMQFAKRETENYKILYHSEKNEQDKNSIMDEAKYELENDLKKDAENE